MLSISEDFMALLERRSDAAVGDENEQLALELIAGALHDCGALSTNEWRYLVRRIDTNKG